MPFSPQQREQLARSAGFPNYDAMILFQRQKEMQRAPQTISGAGAPVIAGSDPRIPPPQQGGGWFGWMGAINNALRGAMHR